MKYIHVLMMCLALTLLMSVQAQKQKKEKEPKKEKVQKEKKQKDSKQKESKKKDQFVSFANVKVAKKGTVEYNDQRQAAGHGKKRRGNGAESGRGGSDERDADL